ncbi:hypothetical protein JHD49_01765 [Sulfurimonas sp. SAG-AH-194-C21]|nr:hypothetical protein [Sulfurimonas sp. SAG-AH-194-C21]MDF1882662.1 hypothetical protein [Sulfurimonas sp. SAG-AH-194-C21]
MRDFRAIITKLKVYLSNDIKRKVLDKDVSNVLKINQARFATMKKRNVTPYEDILLFCESEKLACNEIFFD